MNRQAIDWRKLADMQVAPKLGGKMEAKAHCWSQIAKEAAKVLGSFDGKVVDFSKQAHMQEAWAQTEVEVRVEAKVEAEVEAKLETKPPPEV